MSSSSEFWGIVVSICLFLLILFLQPTLVGSAVSSSTYKIDTKHCNGKGNINTLTGLCDCYSSYRGADCSLRYCPYGASWMSVPQTDNTRNRERVECSNMGTCDIFTGKCQCRPGYSGRACERKSCPSVSNSTCSGHGRCYTMREASLDFDGLALINPPIDYNGWDADAIMGCVCDRGYEGYDCSFRSCPWGRDPTIGGPAKEEKFVMQCQADHGYFSVTMLGRTTQAIPHNATPALFQFLLEQVYSAGSVRVNSFVLGDQQPAVCGVHAPVRTNIWFLDYVGDRPPIRVSYNDTWDTRMWPDGHISLSLSGGAPTLEMLTWHLLTCEACPACRGKIYFKFKDSLSTGLLVNDDGGRTAAELIDAAITNLADLANMQLPNFEVEVTALTAPTTICDATVQSQHEILIKSDIGNTAFLEMFDSSLVSYSVDVPVNITLDTNAGTGALFECSNNGVCDRTTGKCVCRDRYVNGEFEYRAESSDGKGSLGGKGDCGYIDVTTAVCTAVGDKKCNGHGFCRGAFEPCTCDDGWFGYDCRSAGCPSGRAWFDEAISISEAHQLAECSNMGMCDRTKGICECNEGYSGDACQYYDCPYDDVTGQMCSGNGWCYSMSEWYANEGLTYGDEQDMRAYPDAWDAFKIYNCLCAAYTTGGFMGNKKYPPVASRGMVSGRPAQQRNLMGWRGWDCSERNCPVGEKITSSCDRSAVLEKQYVYCEYSGTPFTMSLDGIHYSLPIAPSYTASQIKDAIEYIPTIGNVSVQFTIDNGIATACSHEYNSTWGGFYITFLTDLGDMPLFTVANATAGAGSTVVVTEDTKGAIVVEECNGYAAGYCNRHTGDCVCYGPFTSSNGTNNPGNRGDCGYFYPHPMDGDVATSWRIA